MTFTNEKEFEQALINVLTTKGWSSGILEYKSEKALIENWAKILSNMNAESNRLNGCPLTETETEQLLEQINRLQSPALLNTFINGGYVTIKRDNADDKENYGKEVSLKIYAGDEIAGGNSRYQIARQPELKTRSKLMGDRRGDLMLLINGMPLIHIELKKSGVPVSKAVFQIQRYIDEGVFGGFFSLVQIFVAMSPEECVYFANPGMNAKINPIYLFHWADFNNEAINRWDRVAETLLSIPLAHQLIGFYTIADASDNTLKVLRSYQYYAASQIAKRVCDIRWGEEKQLGGYIWHTTGSGKTMTSFKAAQLIASLTGNAKIDKVLFLMDRIELATQSLREYRNFSGAGLSEDQKNNSVQATEDSYVLVDKLKSTDPNNDLIVTSIQKMSKIHDDSSLKRADLDKIRQKRIVFIIDECHRSTFGEMLGKIKSSFPDAIFFGFTGTPIHEENKKKNTVTAQVFGDELHRYSIADGLRDKNVLPFDTYKVLTYKDEDLRRNIAIEKAKVKDESEIYDDDKKKETFNHYMTLPMAGEKNINGTNQKGIEDYIPASQYDEKHRLKVVEDIAGNFRTLSQGRKFHAIFATSSIPDAIDYYRLLKEKMPQLHIAALFDPSVDNTENIIFKEEALIEIIEDYNKQYLQKFTLPTFAAMKKDIAARLAHKKPYERSDKDSQIDLLIVVDQMLTGFDSKWINTLYLDKVLEHENIIQAFSRTNRIFGNDKPFGTIRYYRRPHTMEKNILAAVKNYSGDKAFGLFVEKLEKNVKAMNDVYEEITELFEQSDVRNFEKLPDNRADCRKFSELFRQYNRFYEAAKIQGFNWSDTHIEKEDGSIEKIPVDGSMDCYLTLAKRYRELQPSSDIAKKEIPDDMAFDIDPYLMAIETADINSDYMNSNFVKYLKILQLDDANAQALQNAKNTLHKSFASLSREDQQYAEAFLRDIDAGNVRADKNKTFLDYVIEYKAETKDAQIDKVVENFGLDKAKLVDLINRNLNDNNINAFGKFDSLMKKYDKRKAENFFKNLGIENTPSKPWRIQADALIKKFIVHGPFDITNPDNMP